MWPARLVTGTGTPTLIVTAHGSADPRAASVTHAVVGRIRRLRPELDVRAAFCEHNSPNLRDALAELRSSAVSWRHPASPGTAGLTNTAASWRHPASPGTAGLANAAASWRHPASPGTAGLANAAVVAPLLLASAYHARTDIPAMINASAAGAVKQFGLRAEPSIYTHPGAVRPNYFREVTQAEVLGEDPALLTVLRQRLAEAGVSHDDDDVGVIVAAVGSSDSAANTRTLKVAPALCAGTRWTGAQLGFVTKPQPSLADAARRLRAAGARRIVVAPWFLAHGVITDRVAEFASAQGFSVTEPLGSHNLVAATVLDRYDAAINVRTAA